MSLQTEKFKTYSRGDRPSASDLNSRGDVLAKIARSLNIDGVQDSTGFITRKTTANKFTMKIFRVVSEATGDGVYTCYEQTLDASYWDDTSGLRKVNDKNIDGIEVLNLAEYDPEATYVAHLEEGDRMAAWKMTDDEANTRWIGLGFRRANADRPRLAFCKADAGAGATIVCYLDTDATGTEITVNCNISGVGALNSAVRRLEDGDRLLVTKIGASWYCTEGFQTSEDCDCYTAP
ncbi:hypothetical protein LCGC14_1793140 [marine sediment metagenome]|uniref:Uncharacterized protein n=1 Tax=marine sediment metagenome TaxID=412755 RepID=A0A0F9HEJ9_9ZZZZ